MGREKGLVGKTGERAALGFLRRRGYRILANNFRTPFGELDAIARKKDAIVFIEVKTRSSDSLGPPSLAVTNTKARHLIKNALCYLKRQGLVNSNWRIDVVSVRLNYLHEVENIELIENAVQTYGYDYRGGLV